MARAENALELVEYIAVTTTPYTLTGSGLVGVNRAGPVTINLPTPQAELRVVVKDESGLAETNNITVQTPGSETIDGAATDVIDTNYGAAGYYCNGTNWFKV